jgi:hypothetical protein
MGQSHKNFWLTKGELDERYREKLADGLAKEIVQRHRELIIEAVKKELEFITLLDFLDKDNEKKASEDTTIE